SPAPSPARCPRSPSRPAPGPSPRWGSESRPRARPSRPAGRARTSVKWVRSLGLNSFDGDGVGGCAVGDTGRGPLVSDCLDEVQAGCDRAEVRVPAGVVRRDGRFLVDEVELGAHRFAVAAHAGHGDGTRGVHVVVRGVLGRAEGVAGAARTGGRRVAALEHVDALGGEAVAGGAVEVPLLRQADEGRDRLRGALAVQLHDDVRLAVARAGVQRDRPGAVLGGRRLRELVRVARVRRTGGARARARGRVVGAARARRVDERRDAERPDQGDHGEQGDQGPQPLPAGAPGRLPLLALAFLLDLLRALPLLGGRHRVPFSCPCRTVLDRFTTGSGANHPVRGQCRHPTPAHTGRAPARRVRTPVGAACRYRGPMPGPPHLRVVVAPVFGTNCCVVASGTATGADCVVVDAGAGVADAVVRLVDDAGLTPRAVLATHGHADHTWDAAALCARYDVPLLLHEDDAYRLADPFATLSPALESALGLHRDAYREPRDVRPFATPGGSAEL